MGVIIGATTTVSFRGSSGGSGSGCTGATQASWGYNPNEQKMYELGNWAPCSTFGIPTNTLNLSFYAPHPGGAFSVLPSTQCEDRTVTASVSPAGCGPALAGVSGNWFVTSYNYSKSSANTPATESWSLMQYIAGNSFNPDFNIMGAAEGSIETSEDESRAQVMTGIDFDNASITTGTKGSVSSGQIGNSSYSYNGTASSIGGGQSVAGETGSGQVSIQYTPVWL